MAGALVGGAFLSAFLQVAFDRLASPQVLNYFGATKFDETLLKDLKRKLRPVNALADDAELQQFRNQQVREWLLDVKETVFQAEDLLDEIYVLSRCQLEPESQITDQVLGSFTSLLSFPKNENEIETRLKKVLNDLHELAKEGGRLGLKVASGVGSKVSHISQSTSEVVENVIYGRDDDIKFILNWLTSDTDKKLSILSIVGMGGVGKTTLVQHVYNDPRADFSIKAWVCVSDEHDSDEHESSKITKKVLEAIINSRDDSTSLQMVQGRLKKELNEKRFLLVLDDVWSIKQREWEHLLTALKFGAHGSKIVVTTRDQKVASTLGSNEIHLLRELQGDPCWQLFAKHAFQNDNPQPNPDYMEIGMRIVEKCKGLPLALKSLGSLLLNKSSSEWECVLKSEIWELDDSDIVPALALSYYLLPSHLKRCFAYCALFPKDYVFNKERLIQLWMAENFLQCRQHSMSPEEVGEQYFNDLLSRSFFQQSRNYFVPRFVMHDLLNDLANYVCMGICFRLRVDKPNDIPKTTRHFSFATNDAEYLDVFERLDDAERLHTFMPTCMSFINRSWHCKMSIDELLSKLKFLHVLSLSGCSDLKEVPDSVGNLNHLRSLDLSHTEIIKLPDSTCSLSNLQILKLNYCIYLKELPDSVGNLNHLRSLDLSHTMIIKLPDSTCSLSNLQILKLNYCRYLKELPLDLNLLTSLHRLEIKDTELIMVPPRLGELKNLHVLMSSFDVGKSSEFTIQQLGELNLPGSLSIGELQNIEDPSNALAVGLKNKRHLVKLELKWNGDRNPDDSSEKERDENVIKNLQPSEHLEKLSIWSYGGTKFPSWLSDNSLRNVVSLKLDSCQSCLRLPCLGRLPFLKDLVIERLDGIVNIDAEFHGSSSSSFTSLEKLEFHDMRGWEKWECQDVTGAFPRLQHLSIVECPKLKGRLPVQLVQLQLKTLFIYDSEHLVDGRVDMQQKRLIISSHIKEAWLLEGIGHIISNTSLQHLHLDGFPNFPMSQSYYFLDSLTIHNYCCDSLVTFPLDSFPTLGKVDLSGCPKLQRISQEHTHNHLKSLRINECPELESLPERMQTLLPSLEKLEINDCPKVELFPEGGLPSNLRSLSLYNCSKLIASADGESFPDEDLLPPSLTSLRIGDCPSLKCLPEGLCQLSSLQELVFESCYSLKCLPEGLCHLSSLQELVVESCNRLKCLPEGLCHLSSLQKLVLQFCNSLECLPEGLCQLSSLQKLFLLGCPKLQCLPEMGLPKSISTLQIWNCPLLHQRCQEPDGEDWTKIAFIQNLDIRLF